MNILMTTCLVVACLAGLSVAQTPNDWFNWERILFTDSEQGGPGREASVEPENDRQEAVSTEASNSVEANEPHVREKRSYPVYSKISSYGPRYCKALVRTATDEWCTDNCRQGYCPQTHCLCSPSAGAYGGGASSKYIAAGGYGQHHKHGYGSSYGHHQQHSSSYGGGHSAGFVGSNQIGSAGYTGSAYTGGAIGGAIGTRYGGQTGYGSSYSHSSSYGSKSSYGHGYKQKYGGQYIGGGGGGGVGDHAYGGGVGVGVGGNNYVDSSELPSTSIVQQKSEDL